MNSELFGATRVHIASGAPKLQAEHHASRECSDMQVDFVWGGS